MAWNFPNSPTANQEYVAPNGFTYKYVGTVWTLQGSGGSQGPTGPAGPPGPSGGLSVNIADVAPGSPVAGQMWWNSSNGNLYIYYNDGSSSQWVQVNNTGAL